MKYLALLAFALTIASTAEGAAVHACDGLDSIGNMVGQVRNFSRNEINVALVDTEEPVSAPQHLVIFVNYGSMERECFAVSATAEGLGFGSIDFPRLLSYYDPAKGLLLTVPVGKYDPETGEVKRAGLVKVRINRKGAEPKVTLEN